MIAIQASEGWDYTTEVMALIGGLVFCAIVMIVRHEVAEARGRRQKRRVERARARFRQHQ